MHDGKAYAADYRYAIPQIGYYTPQVKPPERPLRISSISLDRSSSPNSLITGEYKKDRGGVNSPKPANARIVRWDLDGDGKADQIQRGVRDVTGQHERRDHVRRRTRIRAEHQRVRPQARVAAPRHRRDLEPAHQGPARRS
ncbi:hypothetical protein ACQEVZ_28135 [Dactylosporangium sp. CA-152071]|uniref:hypothetical protein n=1 Tax=Dactylosporangium sp. CA-152071 TaxID=3239933 RepID=UPI003D945A85